MLKSVSLLLFLSLLFCACASDGATQDAESPPPTSERTADPATSTVRPRPEPELEVGTPKPLERPRAYAGDPAINAANAGSLTVSSTTTTDSWLAFHRNHGAPTLDWSDLKITDVADVEEFPVVEYRPADGLYELAVPDANDRRRVDIYGYEAELRTRKGKTERVGSPDSAVLLIEGDLVNQLIFCGTPCTYEAAYWSGPEEVTVLGKVITNDGTAFHPHVWRIDLDNQTVTTYRSEQRLAAEGDYIGTMLN